MAYIDTNKVAQMRKAIRQALPNFTVSVRTRHHSSVDVKIMRGPIPAVETVNVYHYKDHLKDRPDAVRVIDAIIAEIRKVETPKIVSEDGDYGNIPNFYYDVTFGAWDKPYICTDPDAETRLEVKREFNKIKDLKEWQAQQRCGVTTLGPDDLIIPCVLPTDHNGYCSTGR